MRNLDEFKGNVFELWQVCGVLDMFAVAHAFININDYSEDEIEDVLHYYSYENLDDFVQEISPATIERKADGTLDRESPNYIVDGSLLLRCCLKQKLFTDISYRERYGMSTKWLQHISAKPLDRKKKTRRIKDTI
ncbi:MAG: hypothetical protein ACLSB9_22310 [Hydrogeniiclostridium mannosilyticum]